MYVYFINIIIYSIIVKYDIYIINILYYINIIIIYLNTL